MKLLSAYEDFVRGTLSKIPNALDRLRFVAEMRRAGQYEHWGLSKTHGREAAERGIGEAHADTFEEVLSTPVPNLENSVEATPEPPRGDDLSRMLPMDLRGGTKRHLNWIVKVIWLLGRSRRDSSPGA